MRWFLLIGMVMNLGVVQAQFTLSTLYTGWFLPERDDVPHMDRFLFGIDAVQITPVPSGVTYSPWSRGFSVYRVFDLPVNKNMAFGIGGGFNWNNLHSDAQFIEEVQPDNSTFTNWVPFPAGQSYRINKLVLTYADVIAQIRLRFGKRYGFRFYPGFKGGYLLSDYVKFKDRDTKVRLYNTPHVMNYRYGPCVQIAIGNWALSGFYSLTPVFEKNKGVEMNIYSLGLTFLFL